MFFITGCAKCGTWSLVLRFGKLLRVASLIPEYTKLCKCAEVFALTGTQWGIICLVMAF